MSQSESPHGHYSSRQGLVFKKSLGKYYLWLDGGQKHSGPSQPDQWVCSISNQLRKDLVYPHAAPTSIRPHVVAVKEIRQVDPIAVGDIVRFLDAGDGTGLITEVLPRKTKFTRRDPGFKPLEQVMVANVDQVVVVVSAAQPSPRWRLVDRYLAAAEAAELPALICTTKLDLAEPAINDYAQLYRQIGYPVILTSAVTGGGVQELKDSLAGRLSILVGQSGVGKSSLLNRMQPGLGLQVAEISKASGKGKHTTSHLELFPLDGGGGIVDTPGIKYFELWAIDNRDVAGLFREMKPYLAKCRFGTGCSHSQEPGCAIREAVDAGEIDSRRYQSYLRIAQE